MPVEPEALSAAIVTGWSMKSSGVRRAASASTPIVSVRSLRLFSSSKRCSETIPNGSSGTAGGSRLETSSRLSRIVFEPVSTTSPPRRFDAAHAPGA